MPVDKIKPRTLVMCCYNLKLYDYRVEESMIQEIYDYRVEESIKS